MFTLAPHQAQARADCISHLQNSQDKGICVISGAGGKSIVIASIAEYISQYEGYRIIIVTHRKELLIQNISKIKHHSLGMVSDQLGRYEYDKDIVVGGIQTIYNKAEQLGKRHLIIIDECQRLSSNSSDGSRYWQLLNSYPMAKVLGFTALPHRLSEGVVTWGKVCHFTSYKDLLDTGFVTPLSNKVCHDPDLKKVSKVGGDYVQSDFATKCLSDPALLRKTAKKCFDVFQAKGLQKMIGFAPTVEYANNIGLCLHEAGFRIWGKDGLTGVLTGANTKEEREEILRRHKVGEFNALMNVEILTEGYDDPELDMLANWRPTQSLSLHHQMLYRLVRLKDPAIWGMQTQEERITAIAKGSKPVAYVLDFAGNLKVHGGLVDTSWQYLNGGIEQVKSKRKGRICPSCEELVPHNTESCPVCKYVFLKDVRDITIDEDFDENTDINAPKKTVRTYTVSDVEYLPEWKSSNGNKMLKVYYKCGSAKFFEIVFNNQRGVWAKKRGWNGVGLIEWRKLKQPKRITVDTSGKFMKIVRYDW